MHLQQLEEMQRRSKVGMWKGCHWSMEEIQKGAPLLSKGYITGIRRWTSERSLPVWNFAEFTFSWQVHDKYRKFAHLLEVGLWLRKSSWLRTCRDLILLLFLLGIHEVEVCYPLLSLLEHWCQHLCLVNPDRSNWTKFKINSGEGWVWVVA